MAVAALLPAAVPVAAFAGGVGAPEAPPLRLAASHGPASLPIGVAEAQSRRPLVGASLLNRAVPGAAAPAP